jgi:hypothetical protein
VAIAQRAAARIQDDALGAAGASFGGPAVTLDELHLGRASHERQQAQQHQDLDRMDADGGLGHGFSGLRRGRGAG